MIINSMSSKTSWKYPRKCQDHQFHSSMSELFRGFDNIFCYIALLMTSSENDVLMTSSMWLLELSNFWTIYNTRIYQIIIFCFNSIFTVLKLSQSMTIINLENVMTSSVAMSSWWRHNSFVIKMLAKAWIDSSLVRGKKGGPLKISGSPRT